MPMEAGLRIRKFKPPKKGATKPWLAEFKSMTPDLTKLKKQHAGFHACWVHKDDDIDKYSDIGYTIAKAKDYGEVQKEGSSLVRRRMILMEIPVDKHRRSNDLRRMMNKARVGEAWDTKRNLEKVGVTNPGEVIIKGQIEDESDEE